MPLTEFQKRLIAMLLLKATIFKPTMETLGEISHRSQPTYPTVRINPESLKEIESIRDLLWIHEVQKENENTLSIEIALVHPEQLLGYWLGIRGLTLERQFRDIVKASVSTKSPDEIRQELDIFV
jgi:hypothetical protein